MSKEVKGTEETKICDRAGSGEEMRDVPGQKGD